MYDEIGGAYSRYGGIGEVSITFRCLSIDSKIILKRKR
jgi:hypothetical protein